MNTYGPAKKKRDYTHLFRVVPIYYDHLGRCVGVLCVSHPRRQRRPILKPVAGNQR